MLILRWILSSLVFLLVAHIVPGFAVGSFFAALVATLVLGILNAIVRPILILLSLPITVLTLGIFIFVINALMLWLIANIVKGVTITSFSAAFMAALLISFFNWLITLLLNERINEKSGPPTA